MVSKVTKGIIISFWLLFAIAVGAVVLLFSAIAKGSIGYMPPVEQLENPIDKYASQVVSADGKTLGIYAHSQDNRIMVNYNDLSPDLVKALIATEDVRFAEHSGIDAQGLFRAVVKRGILMQKSGGGGSTITQQLAKQLFSPSVDNVMERLFQKPIEWVIAVQLERYYTKEEIINMYLNKFDFLYNAVGIQSAARVYFGKTPKTLKIEEAATLVGMCKNPSYFNPRRHNERTRGRRNTVLEQMQKAGYITQAECDSLKALPLTLHFSRMDHKEGLAPYFREYLRLFLTAKKPERKNYRGWQMQQFKEDSVAWETNPAYGWCNKNKKADGEFYNLYTDGLKIYTTIDSRMQKYAEEAVTEHLGGTLQPAFMAERNRKAHPPFSNDLTVSEINDILNTSIRRTERYRSMNKAGKSFQEIKKSFDKAIPMSVFTWKGVRDTVMSPLDSLKHYKSFFRAGFMAMEPSSGHIKAYVGGPDYRYFQYDMVSTGKRQIGSTIKPILYTLAMQEGLGPCDQVLNVQQTFVLPDGTTWTPRNSTDKREGEMVTLKWGLANSVNNISGWVLKQFTPEAVVQMAHRMGITSYIDPVPAIFLGSSEVSVKEMVGAFSIYANKGVYNAPMMVTKIEDKYGNVLANFYPESREVITENTAFLMANLLQGVVDEGTGRRLRFRYGFKNQIGGKTGTTQNHSDGWFIGITPDLAGGVWVGAEDRSIHFQNLANGQGASMALPIWALFMQKVYADKSLAVPQSDFQKPNGVNHVLDCGDADREGMTDYDSSDEIFD